MLAPEQHALLDQLYWNTKQTVTSLAAQFGLTSTQLDSLALFFRLVADGWRVISAAESQLHRGEYEGWCDDLVDRWAPTTQPGSRYSRLHVI